MHAIAMRIGFLKMNSYRWMAQLPCTSEPISPATLAETFQNGNKPLRSFCSCRAAPMHWLAILMNQQIRMMVLASILKIISIAMDRA